MDGKIIIHYIYNVRHEIAVEGRVLLLARLVDLGGHLGQGEYRPPRAFVAILPRGGDKGLEAADIGQYPLLALDEVRFLLRFAWGCPHGLSVTMVVVDDGVGDGGGLGREGLHLVDMVLAE